VEITPELLKLFLMILFFLSPRLTVGSSNEKPEESNFEPGLKTCLINTVVYGCEDSVYIEESKQRMDNISSEVSSSNKVANITSTANDDDYYGFGYGVSQDQNDKEDINESQENKNLSINTQNNQLPENHSYQELVDDSNNDSSSGNSNINSDGESRFISYENDNQIIEKLENHQLENKKNWNLFKGIKSLTKYAIVNCVKIAAKPYVLLAKHDAMNICESYVRLSKEDFQKITPEDLEKVICNLSSKEQEEVINYLYLKNYFVSVTTPFKKDYTPDHYDEGVGYRHYREYPISLGLSLINGTHKVVKGLMDAYCNVYEANLKFSGTKKDTLLGVACLYNNFAVVKWLLEKKANPNQQAIFYPHFMYKEIRGNTPLLYVLQSYPEPDELEKYIELFLKYDVDLGLYSEAEFQEAQRDNPQPLLMRLLNTLGCTFFETSAHKFNLNCHCRKDFENPPCFSILLRGRNCPFHDPRPYKNCIKLLIKHSKKLFNYSIKSFAEVHDKRDRNPRVYQVKFRFVAADKTYNYLDAIVSDQHFYQLNLLAEIIEELLNEGAVEPNCFIMNPDLPLLFSSILYQKVNKKHKRLDEVYHDLQLREYNLGKEEDKIQMLVSGVATDKYSQDDMLELTQVVCAEQIHKNRLARAWCANLFIEKDDMCENPEEILKTFKFTQSILKHKPMTNIIPQFIGALQDHLEFLRATKCLSKNEERDETQHVMLRKWYTNLERKSISSLYRNFLNVFQVLTGEDTEPFKNLIQDTHNDKIFTFVPNGKFYHYGEDCDIIHEDERLRHTVPDDFFE